MGGIELNLDSADLAPGAYLTLRAVMGGIDVVVPSHWRVEMMGRSVMGRDRKFHRPRFCLRRRSGHSWLTLWR